ILTDSLLTFLSLHDKVLLSTTSRSVPMRVDDALRQIEAIHDRLDQDEAYRGFQVRSVALAGLLGLIAGVVRDWWLSDFDFVLFWVVTAIVCGSISAGSAFASLFARHDPSSRRKTVRLLCQFLPSILSGIVVTAIFDRADLTAYLPGLWSLLFGLGLLA